MRQNLVAIMRRMFGTTDHGLQVKVGAPLLAFLPHEVRVELCRFLDGLLHKEDHLALVDGGLEVGSKTRHTRYMHALCT